MTENRDLTSLIRPYFKGMEKEVNVVPPFAAVFQKDNRKLLFVGAQHVFGDSPNPTFALITRLLDSFKPDALMLECAPCGMSMPHELGEVDFARTEAQKRGVADVMGCEPETHILKKALLAEGFSEDDFRFFHFARTLSCAVRTGKANIRALYRQCLSDIPFSRFRNWFHRHIGRADRISLGKSGFYAPIMEGGYTQRISATEGYVRDCNIFNTISMALDKKNRIMAVYGAGHFLTLRPALEALVGAPAIILEKQEPEVRGEAFSTPAQ